MLRPMSLPAYRASSRIPPRAGVRLKLEHAASIVADARGIAFFEIEAEDVTSDRAVQHLALSRIRHRLPLSLHAVDLSIGGEGPLDRAHLARLQRLVALYRPGMFSAGLVSPDRNRADPTAPPLHYDEGSLARTASHIEQVQNVLGLCALIENPATQAATESSAAEVGCLTELVARAGCGLLLDVSNLHASAVDHGFDPFHYVETFPAAALGKIRLRGAFQYGAYRTPIDDLLWRVYERTIERSGPVPTSIGWVTSIPSFATLAAQAGLAEAIMQQSSARNFRRIA